MTGSSIPPPTSNQTSVSQSPKHLLDRYYLTSNNIRCTLGEIKTATNTANDISDTNFINGWGYAFRILTTSTKNYFTNREKKIRWECASEYIKDSVEFEKDYRKY